MVSIFGRGRFVPLYWECNPSGQKTVGGLNGPNDTVLVPQRHARWLVFCLSELTEDLILAVEENW